MAVFNGVGSAAVGVKRNVVRILHGISGVGAEGKEAELQAFFCRGGLLGLEKWRER